ncbi:hypothetical protein A2164_04325 [Candidatus Curtissbacteria bacterium RBG_13_35_7]|uniref:Aminoglycoside phosphotransferase domain-containing protein n=1 Tax=Candidatus Curtissbacteria bacterium RBG_13_35_7 TaxID=1797705 RepID=A0A1F5G5Z6_9BACT|nr:MAG: hypothetical protein A2164_04325 [Candidatus Curtissbacteria bacterium RBG_13_35_7]
MQNNIGAFFINVNGRVLDYRIGKELDLNIINNFFEKEYKVRKLWSGGRHVLGILEKSDKKLFLKLATTEGISAVTRIEKDWNEVFNKQISRSKSRFWVPKNYECGEYNGLFYLITDKFEGQFLSLWPKTKDIENLLTNSLEHIIDFSETIQKLNTGKTQILTYNNLDHQQFFLEKTRDWFGNIPDEIKADFRIFDLLQIVEKGVINMACCVRHGDFAPWHFIKLNSGQLGLIDGEHATTSGVEYYDIGYLTQRIFCVLKKPELAGDLVSLLNKRKYDILKLKIILAARAIGGFLDESLALIPDYRYIVRFTNWIKKL